MAYVYEEIIVGGSLSVEPGRGYIMDSSPGCLITGDGTQSVVLPRGGDGTFLMADSTSTNGLTWSTPSSSVTAGSGLYYNPGTEKLNVGSSNTIGTDSDSVFVVSNDVPGQPLLSVGAIGAAAKYGPLDISDSTNNVSGALAVDNGGSGVTSAALTPGELLAFSTAGDVFITTGITPDILPKVFRGTTTDDAPLQLGSVTLSGTAQTATVNVIAASATEAANFRHKVIILNGSVVNTDRMYAPSGTDWNILVSTTPGGGGVSVTVFGSPADTVNWAASVEVLSVTPP